MTGATDPLRVTVPPKHERQMWPNVLSKYVEYLEAIEAEPSGRDALQAIADLPTGQAERIMQGQEQAYRAVEALFSASPPIVCSDATSMVYTNHRGETAARTIKPISVYWGSTEWHIEPQWLMLAYDLVKQADRIFALSDCDFTPGETRPAPDSFQTRVKPWLDECFGPEISADVAERNHRFIEESLELVQALGCSKSEALQLVEYVFGREIGKPAQEVGGVMLTLAALCLASDMDLSDCGEAELTRVSTPETIVKIRAKQAAKPKHSPLPQFAPVPIEARPLEWKPIGTRLQTATVFGLTYSLVEDHDCEYKFKVIVAGVTVYEGDYEDDAKQDAQIDLKTRIRAQLLGQ